MKRTISLASALLVILAGPTTADELTKMVEQDLVRLGYEPGPVDGEATMETTIAITKYQAANNIEITGEINSELARSLMAAQPGGSGAAQVQTPAATPQPAPAPAPADSAALQAAQQACLQEKMAAAQAAKKKKRGLGRLLSAVSRTASRGGSSQVAEATGDIYDATATADDLAAAAKDLGLTQDDVEACQNPT